MQSPGNVVRRRRIPRWLIPALGYAVSIVCLIWVYQGFNWREQLPKVLATDWRWITLAVVTDVCVYVVQGWRWSLLLRPIERVPSLRSVQAIYIGLFANEILPLRSGEVIRAYLQGRWNSFPFSIAAASVLIERMLDGTWLMLGFWVITWFIDLPGYLVAGAQIVALIVVVLGVLLTVAVVHKKHVHAAVRESRWATMLRNIVDGSHDMGRSISFPFAAVLSLVYLVLQIGPIFAVARGYGLHLSLVEAAVVMVILRLGSVPPQAPSNVGGFQFFAILAVSLFGVARDEATGFATLLFVVVTVPLWIGGFISLLATRMRLVDLHRDARREARNGGSNQISPQSRGGR